MENLFTEGGLVQTFAEQRSALLESLATPEPLRDWRSMQGEQFEAAFHDPNTPDAFRKATYRFLSRTELNLSAFIARREAKIARLNATFDADVQTIRSSRTHALARLGFERMVTFPTKTEEDGDSVAGYVARSRLEYGDDAVQVVRGGVVVVNGLARVLETDQISVYAFRNPTLQLQNSL